MSTKNTLQKQLVASAVVSLKNHPSAEEVHAYISKDYPSISLATVYRNLNSLSSEGALQKIFIANSSDRFDHTLEKHTHCRCSVCDRVYDFPFTPNIMPESLSDNNFKVTDYYFVIDGVCKNCTPQI